jgi:hypothetical protein
MLYSTSSMEPRLHFYGEQCVHILKAAEIGPLNRGDVSYSFRKWFSLFGGALFSCFYSC